MKEPSQSGYTLIELLVVIVIMGIMTMGIMTVFLTSQEQYRVRDAMIRMQQQARLAMNDMEREVKLTGYGFMDLGNLKINVYGKDENGNNAIIKWGIVEAVDGGVGLTNKTDRIAVRYLEKETDTEPDVVLTEENTESSSNVRVSTTTGFQTGDLFMVYDPGNLGEPASMYQVTALPTTTTILHNPGLQGPYNPPSGFGVSYPVGSKVINLRTMKARQVRYFVDSGENLVKEVMPEGAGTVTRRIIASGIQDLQVKYLFKNGQWRDAPVDGDPNLDVNNLRAVRLSIIVRTAKADPRYGGADTHQLTGVHGNGAVYSGQGYRRMEMSSIISLRNLSMRDHL